MTTEYSARDNQRFSAANGVSYAYRDTGSDAAGSTTPDTIEQMARDAIAFLAALDISRADLLGFSIGSFVAQQIALTHPVLVRRLVLASSAPQGADGMHSWAPPRRSCSS
jgi:pimeloyl-ACP methyl ester carboxylesterase